MNNLVPAEPEFQVTLAKHQSEISRWLFKSEEVPTTAWVSLILSQRNHDKAGNTHNGSLPGNIEFANEVSDNNKVSLMELVHALTQEYLAAKHAWKFEREGDGQEREGGRPFCIWSEARQTTAIRHAQLKAKYTDAVV